MSSYPPNSPGDAAAHALSSLSINKAGEQRYGPGGGPPSNYPPSYNTSSPHPSQGMPYLASPISGVVTGDPYSPPASAYTQPPPYESHDHNKPDAKGASPLRPAYGSPAPPFSSPYPPPDGYPSSYAPSAPHDLNLPENLDVFSGKGETMESSHPPQYYGRPPASQPEEYTSAPSEYPPKFNESNPGNLAFPSFSSYGATPPAPAVPYPQPELHDGQGKQKTKKQSDSPTSNYEGSPSFPGAAQPPSGYPPSEYPPLSGSHNQSGVSVGYPPQQTGEQHPPPAGYLPQNVRPGEQASEQTVSSSSEIFSEGDTEKGFNHGQHGQHGQFGQPGQHGQFGQPGQHGQFGQPGQHGYGGYPQYGYGQPMYPQPGHEAYPSHGYAPSYPPAYPAHGYAPEGYPSHGFGVPGYVQPAHGGHGMSHHAPDPYGAYGAAPYYGGHGSYKQHKGGHKGYKHKKMKKMKKGHYLHFEQPYGYGGGHHGGHSGGHHGGHHQKHHHGKHKH